MEAKVYYVGSVQSLNHQAPSGNRYVFIGPNVPTKISDSRDIEFYSKKASFRVMVSEEETDKPVKKLEEKPEKEEQVSEPEEVAEKLKKKVSESRKNTTKPKRKGGK